MQSETMMRDTDVMPSRLFYLLDYYTDVALMKRLKGLQTAVDHAAAN